MKVSKGNQDIGSKWIIPNLFSIWRHAISFHRVRRRNWVFQYFFVFNIRPEFHIRGRRYVYKD